MIPFERFLAERLPAAPARVLEVGCGRGELTTALAVAGYDVVGIDPAAPDGERFRRLKLEDLGAEEGPFDAVVAAFALHHVRDLEAALEKIARLLRPGGVLALDEFGWELLDEPTLDWLYGQLRALAAADGREAPVSPEALREEWESEHLGVHGSEAMRAALAQGFDELVFERQPYLYRRLGGPATAVLEQALVESDAIRALGFRYAGTPRRAE